MKSWLPTMRLPREILSYPGWVAFSPDQKLLAMELSPAVIHLVDAATGRTVAKLEDPRSDRAQWLGFTPDGARLVTISTILESHPCLGSGGDPPVSRRDAARLGFAACLTGPRGGYPTASRGRGPARRRRHQDEQVADDQARRDIESFRLAVESNPASAAACNDLAWAYVTAPEHLREPSQALALAERATRLNPHDRLIRNTLGVAYYRVGRYREAADTLRGNLPGQKEKYLAADLYFLAMSHHRLGEDGPGAGLLHLGQSRRGVADRAHGGSAGTGRIPIGSRNADGEVIQHAGSRSIKSPRNT